jgi:hypothetical protein
MFERIPDCGGPCLHETAKKLTRTELAELKRQQRLPKGINPFTRKKYFQDGRMTKSYQDWWVTLTKARA